MLLLLMLVLGAAPGMAAGAPCHETLPSTAMAAMPGMPAHHDHGAPAEHRCPGCMPLPEALAARLPPPIVRAALPRPVPVRFDRRAAGPPAAPPPRIG